MSNIVIFAATSAIAGACARRFVALGDRLFLTGRDAARLEALRDDLRVRGGPDAVVETAVADLDDVDGHEALFRAAETALGRLDVVLMAQGVLPDQKACEASVEATLAAIRTNGLSVIALATLAANRFEAQGHGTLAVIGSVAGDRGRQSNYVYGAAKGLVSTFLEGLRNRLAHADVAVVTIKPGFVDTPMTAHVEKKGLLWASPDTVAAGIVAAVTRRRDVVYLPWFWAPIMLIVRHVPEAIFKRLRL